jgi:hypothetical protein
MHGDAEVTVASPRNRIDNVVDGSNAGHSRRPFVER